MARINTPQLIENATKLTDRVDQVQRDPAVRKAWVEVGGDAAAAYRSLTTAVHETRAAWRRTNPGAGTPLAGAPA